MMRDWTNKVEVNEGSVERERVVVTSSIAEYRGSEVPSNPEASNIGDSPRKEEKSLSSRPPAEGDRSLCPKALSLIQECLFTDQSLYPHVDSSSGSPSDGVFPRAAVMDGEVGSPLCPD
jgi:hypothetical protein